MVGCSSELGVNDVGVFVPVVDAHPHLPSVVSSSSQSTQGRKIRTCLSECAQPGENAAPDPRAVLALGRRKDLDAHVLDGKPLQLGQQPVAKALCERGPAGEHDVGVEGLAQVQVGAVDGVDHHLVDALVFQPHELRVEQDLGGAEALGADLARGSAALRGAARTRRLP